MRFDPSFVAVKRSLIFSQVVSPPCVAGVKRAGRGGKGKGEGTAAFFPPPLPPLFAPATHNIKLLVAHSFYRFQLCLYLSRAWARINVGLIIGIGVTSPPSLFLMWCDLSSLSGAKNPAFWPFFSVNGLQISQVRFQKVGQTYIVCSSLGILFFYTHNHDHFSVIPPVHMLQSLAK